MTIRSPHHYVPLTFLQRLRALLRVAAPGSRRAALRRARRRRPRSSACARWSVRRSSAGAITTVRHVPAVAQLYVWRLAPFGVLLALVSLSAWLAPLAGSTAAAARGRAVLLVIGAAAWRARVAGAGRRERALMVAPARRAASARTAVACFAMRCSWARPAPGLPGRRRQPPRCGLPLSREEKLFGWAQHTPTDALFAIPPDLDGLPPLGRARGRGGLEVHADPAGRGAASGTGGCSSSRGAPKRREPRRRRERLPDHGPVAHRPAAVELGVDYVVLRSRSRARDCRSILSLSPTDVSSCSTSPPMSHPEDPRSRTERLALLAAYAVAGLCLLPGFTDQINPDGVSYLASARKYLAGDFAAAATAFWSPLYTWLLAVPLGLGVPALLSAKLVDLLSGARRAARDLAAALGAPRRSGAARGARRRRRYPVLLGFGLTVATPDLLACAIVLHLLADLAGEEWWTLPHAGPALGLLMAAAYLAKAYALGFVAVLFALVLVLDLWRRRPSARASRGAAPFALAALLLVVGGWACAARPQVRPPAGRRRRNARAGASTDRGTRAIRCSATASCRCPTAAAQSAWDDPTLLRLPSWNALGSPEERAHFRALVSSEPGGARGDRPALLAARRRRWRCSRLCWPARTAIRRPAGRRRSWPWRRSSFPPAIVVLHLRERFLSALCVLLLVLGTFAVGALRSWLAAGRALAR